MLPSNAFADQTVLVTGGAGFIGSAMIRYLLDETQAQVVNVDKLTYAANLASIPQSRGNARYKLEKADICDGPTLRRIFEQYRPASVMNLAAESHVDRSIDGPSAFVQTNLVGTFSLLHEALRYWQSLGGVQRDQFRLLHVSTDEVFGSLTDDGLFSEESPYAPNSPYSATKAGSDHLVRAWRETYNIGSRNERTNRQVVETICDLLDEQSPCSTGSRRALVSFVPDRPGHDKRYAIDPSKIENALGWRPRESFESGLARTVRWYLENRPWWEEILHRGYRAERAGLGRA